jgi:von Willebrand factor type A domain.
MERIALAKDELLTALEKLRPGTFFNLVKFSNNPVNLHPNPVRLSKKSVKSAKQFVLGLQPGGGTNIYDSLAEVLKAGEVDTIFFLSDGAPSMGTFIDTERILEEILRLNEESQVTIHTISVGFTSTFMEQLAEQNRGSYIVAGR